MKRSLSTFDIVLLMLCALTIRALEDFQKGVDATVAQNLPVVSASVIEQDNPDPVQASDASRMINVNKMLTDTVILQLMDEGALTLDDRLAQWLPEVAMMVPDRDAITLGQLLNSDADLALDGDWSRGSADAILLGMVIEAATGQSLVENYHTRIFDPVGMTQTHLTGSEVTRR
jgi:D-alanyl-D-alanine carboxypeptidase